MFVYKIFVWNSLNDYFLRHNLGHLGINLCKQIPFVPSPSAPNPTQQLDFIIRRPKKKKTGLFQPNGTNLRRVCIFSPATGMTFWNKDDSGPILIKLLSLQWKSLFFPPCKLYSFIFPPFPLRKILGSILTQKSEYSCLYRALATLSTSWSIPKAVRKED